MENYGDMIFSFGKYSPYLRVSLVNNDMLLTDAWDPMKKSGNGDLLTPPLLLYFRKHFPARKAASHGICSLMKKDSGSVSSRSSILSKLIETSE
jgi:hypothetical protein